MNKVLYCICRHAVRIDPYSYLPFSSTAIAESLGESLYRVRKELKRLKADGLIVSDCVCEYSDWDCMNHIMRGYILTDAGRKSEEYAAAYAEEREIVKEVFELDIGDLSNHFSITFTEEDDT